MIFFLRTSPCMGPKGKCWQEIQMVIKNRIVNKVALDEDTDEVARETPQSVETLLKPLFLTLIPGYKSGPTVDLSDLNLNDEKKVFLSLFTSCIVVYDV